ncbi:MAG: hypothetical protein ACTHYM_08975 [Actinomycetaceae bacterium]
MTSLPSHVQSDVNTTPDTRADARRPWHRRIPAPTWLTTIFAILPAFVSFHTQRMRTVNGEIVEFFRFDIFHVVAAIVLLAAFVQIIVRRRSADPADHPPLWTIVVGAAGLAVGVYLVLTAHTGLDGVNAYLASR